MQYFQKVNWKILWFFPKLKDWKYKIVEVKRIRSIPQNSMYWGFILKYIVSTYADYGYIHTTWEIHKIFKKYLLPRVREKSDFSKKYVWKIWSTAKLKTKPFSQYIDKIKLIFEFWEMDKIGLEKIDPFVIPDIGESELLEWIDRIV